MSKEKYGCFKVSNVEDRCIKLDPLSDYDPSFPTKQECIRNCNMEEEEKALAKLKEKFKLKDLIEKIKPGVISSFDKIKDIPLLNYKGEPYNKKVFNNDELRHFYRVLELRNRSNKHHPNKFLDDLVQKFNCTYGSTKNFFYDKTSKIEISTRFSDEKNGNEVLLNELINFKSSSHTFLIKDIDTKEINTPIGHISLLLIKKETNRSLTFFIFDPTSGNLGWLYDQIELQIHDLCLANSIEHKVIQLSKFYGIQDFERLKLLSEDHYTFIEQNYKNIKEETEKNINIFNREFIIDIVRELAKKYSTLSKIDLVVGNQSLGDQIFPTNFIDFRNYSIVSGQFYNLKDLIKSNEILVDIFSPKKGWIKQNIDAGFIKVEDLQSMASNKVLLEIGKSYFENIFEDHLFEEDINQYIKKYINDLFTQNFNENFIPLIEILDEKLHELAKDEFIISENLDELRDKVNHFYNFDYFSGYCYMWCYYIILLILMNESIDPYIIIKCTLFQNNDEKIMRKILNNILDNNDNKKYNPFHKDFVSTMKTTIDKAKKDMLTIYKPEIIELQRKLFFKITNLQTLNIMYNKTFDKYINYSLIPPSEQQYSFSKFIPQKADDLLQDFTLSGVDPSLGLVELREAIINTVIAGELLPRVNEKINATLPKGTLTYEEKYLKYKQKYLMLKSLLKN